ncbi:hypothetical protein SSP24_67150 [Streptomyces spinoverrucosus]|uniref:L-rhamnose mutarotase n=2 Tax=Streptomyces spinoverrucosus TaxID=284043 RepID=A0A4Y3VTU6_9ACTN|nr:hypothetical protein SSP24_67150 [Streptomyces spinoverrucosus]GHB93654.1 hypothetical protein GCM10010397_78050 [Streptomyces spinoverrucosus]
MRHRPGPWRAVRHRRPHSRKDPDETGYLREDTLFGYFEYHGDDFEAGMAAIGADAATQAWWKLTGPCQEPWADTGTGGSWSDLTEIWHLTPSATAT